MESYSPSLSTSKEIAMLLLTPMMPPFEAPCRRHAGVPTVSMMLSDDALCRYPSKMCHYTRVRKASGALHRYCAYHRSKANANQKRWVDRHRTSAISPTASSSSASSSFSSTSSGTASPLYDQTKYRWIMAASTQQRQTEVKQEASKTTTIDASATSAASLSDDDWTALLGLLVPAPAPVRSNRRHRVNSLVAAEAAY